MIATFNNAFANARPVTFNPLWANGTGYFDHAVEGAYAPTLNAGEAVSATCPAGRRMILIGTPKGNVVLFKRYTDESSNRYAINASSALRVLFGENLDSASLNNDRLAFILGTPEYAHSSDNLGHRLAQVYDRGD
jgi:hypothetical protein